VFKHLQEKRPGDHVERLCKIHLEQNCWKTPSIKPATCKQNGAKVFVNLAPLDEG
jgi:hypothetical protein